MNQRTRSLLPTLARVPAGWWVLLLTLPAVLPLARTGFFQSDDGLFHVYRLTALERAVRAGVLYPRWFPEFAFGYGHPVLNFYGPLAYYWGLPFMFLGADAAQAMLWVFATGLIASALGMYRFARLHLAGVPAGVAAVVYAYLPYHLVDLYVRGAVAEFLAFVWFPFVLWAVHRLVDRPQGTLPNAQVAQGQSATERPAPHAQRKFRRPPLQSSRADTTTTAVAVATLLIAALVLTHSLSAFIFAPLLAGYSLLLLLKQLVRAEPQSAGRHLRRATGRLLLALALAVALSAFYWLPLLAESRFVGLGHGASQGYRDHLLPWTKFLSFSLTYPYQGDPGAPRTFPIGLVQVLIIGAGLVQALRYGRGQQRWVSFFFLVVALLSAFMLTTASLPLWRTFERGLAFLQYPWRFQALTALAAALLAGVLVQRLAASSGRAGLALGAVLVLSTGLWALWRLPVAPATADLSVEGMWQVDRDRGQVGTTWTGEYLPIWVSEQRWALSHPAPALDPGDQTLPAGQINLTGVGYSRYGLTLDAPQGMDLVLHQFYYPGWSAVARWEGGSRSYQAHPAGVLGLAAFDLTPLSGSLAVRLGLTPAQLAGALISLITALGLAVALVAQYQLRFTLGAGKGRLLAAGCYLLLAVVLVASLVLPNGYLRAATPVNANLEGTVELLAFTTDKAAYRSGEAAQVTLYWRALRNLGQNYKAFVHLTDAAMTRQPAQHDGDPGAGFTPTSRWLPGEIVPDTHQIQLPADLPPGRYRLWAGMYSPDTIHNLAVLSAAVPVADGRILLGELSVLAP